MRPRLSLRMLLVLTALAAAACYWWVARPTIVAARFIAAFAAGDQMKLESLWTDSENESFYQSYLHSLPVTLEKENVTLSLAPRSWQDILHGRRWIELRGKGHFPDRVNVLGSMLTATGAGVRQRHGSEWSFRG
jgi:hypothetical protein